MYNEFECELLSEGVFGYIHVANMLVVTINRTINVNIVMFAYESMIILMIIPCNDYKILTEKYIEI